MTDQGMDVSGPAGSDRSASQAAKPISAEHTGIDRALLAVLAASAAYAVAFSVITVRRHGAMATTTFDLGIYDQGVWLASQGCPLFLTTRGLHLFGDHFSPVLLVFAPILRCWDDPRVLLVLQSFACGAGAVPLYLMARAVLRDRPLSLVIALSYLAYPALAWMNCFDFHPDSLMAPLLLLACLGIETRRTRLAIVASLCVLLCKETGGASVMALGAYACARRLWASGSAMVLLGGAGMAVALLVQRAANGGESSAYLSLYSRFGSTAAQIAASLVREPGVFSARLADAGAQSYYAALLVPVGFLPLGAPEALLPAVPMLLANLLSARPEMATVYYQYNAAVIPFVFLGVVHGARELLRVARLSGVAGARLARFVELSGLSACSVAAVLGGPMFVRSSEPLVDAGARDEIVEARAALSAIQRDASVSAQTAAAAQISHRRRIYMWPNPFLHVAWGNSAQALRDQMGGDLRPFSPRAVQRALHHSDVEYIVLGPWTTSRFPLDNLSYRRLALIMLQHPDYGVVRARGVIVLRKGADHESGLQLLCDSSPGVARLLHFVGYQSR